jgi:cell division septation protein DedD
MDTKRILKERLTVLVATTMVIGSISAALMVSGCSADTAKSIEQPTAQSKTASEKAAAEAEAAEEEFAKAKNSKSDSAQRHVASVHKKKASGDQAYIVQVGTFAVEENANKIALKLKAAGLPVFTKKIERANGLLYAVRIEPTPNRSEAEKFVSSVKAATGEASLILSVGR